ncbi:uncharacterized protein HaLaN_01005 [Haematococcus lacustris]|uniref:Uncharacterized protein n=1 Tax=Haematococcus lacustris TaxID=44745 RepID=A0A699YHM2_HAELA|nr:uncharacterized protein HaLaN_01005 [Haematococcus lacustris]
MELNPVSRNYLAVTHSRVDTQGFLIKVLMTCISTFVTNLRWMSVLQCALALVLLWSYLYWEPFQHGVMNQIRVGSYAAVLWCASLLIFLKHLPGVDAQDGNAVVNWEKSLTQAMWLGLGPAFVLGALASWVRLYYLQVVVPRRFRRAGPDDKLTQVYRFTDPRQVEIVARCVRKWVDEDTLQPEATKTAEVVIKAGVAMLPNNCFMTILNSSFLIEVVGSYHSGYTQLQAAKKQDPSALERFAILW